MYELISLLANSRGIACNYTPLFKTNVKGIDNKTLL